MQMMASIPYHSPKDFMERQDGKPGSGHPHAVCMDMYLFFRYNVSITRSIILYLQGTVLNEKHES